MAATTPTYPPGSIGSILAGWRPTYDGRTSSILLRELSVDVSAEDGATDVLQRVDQITTDWPHQRRFNLVWLVRAIVEAEMARAESKPAVVGPEYQRIATEGMQAAQLVKTLCIAFPEGPSPAGPLISQLMAFVAAALEDTTMTEYRVAMLSARQSLKEFRTDVRTAVFSNAVLTELVTFMLNQKAGFSAHVFDESTIRHRYQLSTRTIKSPAFKRWDRGWRLLKEIATLSREMGRSSDRKQVDEFSSLFRARLQPLNAGSPRGRVQTDSTTLSDARALRAELTRRLQLHLLEGPTIFRAEINVILGELFPGAVERQRRIVSAVKARSKPSDVAARLSAEKYDLPLRDVRSGRVTAKKARLRPQPRIVYSNDLVAAEHVIERRRRGHGASSASLRRRASKLE